MPHLTAESSEIFHFAQNVALFFLAAFFTPAVTFFTIASQLVAGYLTKAKRVGQRRKRHQSSPDFKQRTILVTGVGMSKGLHIARAFYRAGHKVIGADFEPYRVPVCGRFSIALQRFYRLTKPQGGSAGSKLYVQGLLEIIHKEKVELWVSCSGVASAVEDAEAKEMVEKLTKCKAIQFGVSITETLHEKDSFIKNTERLGLNVPETSLIVSSADALSILYSDKQDDAVQGRRYIMKSVGMDDSIRADMTLLPLPQRSETEKFLARLRPSASRPFVLQQYISGPEYCTHSICVAGEVLAFTACESAELLMHYKALAPSTDLFKAMQTYTKKYAAAMGPEFTGHFSMDFMLEGGNGGKGAQNEEEWMDRIFPIECNPRAHTAVVLFTDKSEEMADAYLKVLSSSSTKVNGNGSHAHPNKKVVIPDPTTPGYYWIGHDFVTRLIVPTAMFLTLQGSLKDMVLGWMEFVDHVLFWRDGTYEIWDPWPFWWLYVIYWPGMFATSLGTRTWWTRCNVSTTKMFKCK